MPPPVMPDPADERAAAADLDAAAQAALLAGLVRSVPLPSGALSGWSSLCAEEYARAMRALHTTVLAAADALADAGRPG